MSEEEREGVGGVRSHRPAGQQLCCGVPQGLEDGLPGHHPADDLVRKLTSGPQISHQSVKGTDTECGGLFFQFSKLICA